MKNVLFLICAIALLTASFVSAAHAHIDTQNVEQHIELSADQNNTDNSADSMCDMHCSHHHHIAISGLSQSIVAVLSASQFGMDSDNINSAPLYGLKRPPRA